MQAEEGVKAAKAKLYDLSMPLFETEDARTALCNAAEAINCEQAVPQGDFCRQVNPEARISHSQ
jgi:hypothetical protein